MATQRTKIGGVGPAASQHALDTAVSGKPAGGRDSGLQVLAQSPGWYQKATDGRGHDRSDSHCWGPPLLDDAAVFRTLSLAELSVPSSRARLQDSCATAGGLPRRLFHHGSRLLPAHRLSILSHSLRGKRAGSETKGMPCSLPSVTGMTGAASAAGPSAMLRWRVECPSKRHLML